MKSRCLENESRCQNFWDSVIPSWCHEGPILSTYDFCLGVSSQYKMGSAALAITVEFQAGRKKCNIGKKKKKSLELAGNDVFLAL